MMGVLVKTTLVDYPGKAASAYFMTGCDLRCPYCHNKALVVGSEGGKAGGNADGGRVDANGSAVNSSIEELFRHLEKRKGIISGFVLSGGEPLSNITETIYILRYAKELGYSVKLDTNGTLPDALERIAADSITRPDFIAMDIKTSPNRYGELAIQDSATITSPQNKAVKKDYASLLKRSIAVIADYRADAREWRTVLVPHLVGEKDIDEMASVLPQDAVWQFAQFEPGGCIDADYDMLQPMTDCEAEALVRRAQSRIKGARMR